MSRHAIARVLVVLPLAAWLLLLAAPGPARTGGPNIVLVVVDAMRADALGSLGSTAGVTPHIDRLAADGLSFTRMTSQAPWTGPSFASIVSSRYPSEHGEGSRARNSAGIPTLAELLRAGGYRTAAFLEADSNFLRRGFDHYELPAGDHHARFANPDRNGAAVTFGRARDWIARQGRGPFFVLVHTFEAHDYYLGKAYQQAAARERDPGYDGPFLAWQIRTLGADLGAELIDDLLPAGAADIAFVRYRYEAGIAAADAEVGLLRELLRSRGLEGRTVLAVTSDHGEGFAPGLGRLHHGGRLHDDLLHVPFVVAWPGRVEAGRVDWQAQSVDILPTLLMLAGRPAPPGARGRALLAAGDGPPGDGHRRYRPAPDGDEMALAEESVWEVLPGGRRIMSETHQVAGYFRGAKLIHAGSEDQLFDLERDPLEQSNLAASRPFVVERLRDQVRRSLKAGVPATGRPPAELLDLLRSLGYIQ